MVTLIILDKAIKTISGESFRSILASLLRCHMDERCVMKVICYTRLP